MKFNVEEILNETNDSMWVHDSIRETNPGTPHKDTEHIALRSTEGHLQQDVLAHSTDILLNSDVLYNLVWDVMAEFGAAHVGRVAFVKLKAGGTVDEHIDEGPYSDYFTSRVHLPLVNPPGCSYIASGEEFFMNTGETFIFPHKVPHSVHNASDEDRITIIMDLKVL